MIALDCTFRDGGYYTNFKFDLNLVNHYLKIMEKAKIHAIEIGFRSPFKSDFANISDKFIWENLYIPNIKYFGVMVNNNEMNSEIIKNSFCYVDESPINLVRSAVHFKDINQAESVCKDLKNLGYSVCCNLMQAANRSDIEIRKVAKKIKNWKSVDILYLADSLGNMNHDSVNIAYKAIWQEWYGPVGFHAHNNKGQALNNSLEAVDIGVDWIDSTIMGMGRGAGNTETEYLLNELNKRGFGEFELKDIYELTFDFIYLKQLYDWRPSLFYYLSAEYDIHPIYIQKMITDNYSAHTILGAIFYLKNKKANSFNNNFYERSLHGKSNNNNTSKNE